MPDKQEGLNPEIKTTTIGVRAFREISIYPLSVGEQLKLTDLITKGLQEFFKAGEDEINANDVKFVSFIVDLIKENIGEIISIVTDFDEPEEILNDMTNDQLLDFAEVVYDMNFGNAKKKLMSLIQKIKGNEN